MSNKISIDSNSEIIITTKDKGKVRLPKFIMMGRKGKSDIDFDLPCVLGMLSVNATRLFWRMVRARDINTNSVMYLSSNLSKYDKNKLSISFKELREHDLVKKIKRENYLINPSAIIPLPKEFDAVLTRYKEL